MKIIKNLFVNLLASVPNLEQVVKYSEVQVLIPHRFCVVLILNTFQFIREK